MLTHSSIKAPLIITSPVYNTPVVGAPIYLLPHFDNNAVTPDWVT